MNMITNLGGWLSKFFRKWNGFCSTQWQTYLVEMKREMELITKAENLNAKSDVDGLPAYFMF